MNSGNNESWVGKMHKKFQIDTAEPDAVGISPDGRYLRYNEILGRGVSKNVYKGFDKIDGIEVAWNQIDIEDALQSSVHLERLYSEVHLLRTLKHENVIRSYASWVDGDNRTINIITELFTSGSLRQYRNKHKSVDMKAMKSWARQILRGLDYLHTHNPPIIHRDLKCDNILVNGNHGEVKIGDLGLATIMQQPTAKSIIGTFEFMAPELYDAEYNELVDIYSFGMCMLELVTCEYPYSECGNQAQIFKKVSDGIKPAALAKIKDSDVRSFIEKCLAPAFERPSAAELLKMHFLSCEDTNAYTCGSLQPSYSTPNSVSSIKSDSPFMDLDPSCKMLSGSTCESMIEGPRSCLELHNCNERYEFSLKGEKYDENSITLTLRIADYSGQVQNVQFEFFLNADTASSIAAEMVEALDLMSVDVDLIAEMINTLIGQLVPCLGSSSGILIGQRSLDEETTRVHGKEGSERGFYSEVTGIASNGAPLSVRASPQHFNPSTSNAMPNNNFLQADYAVEKHRRSIERSLTRESVKSPATSFEGSWITASSDMSSSVSSLSLTDKENELSNDLKLELTEIYMQYQQRCRELLKIRETAVENVKRKWIMKRIYIL